MVPVSFLLGVGGHAGTHGGRAKASEGSWGKSVVFAFLKELSERAWLGNIFCAAHLPTLGKAWSPASWGVPATPGSEEEEGQQAPGKGGWSWGISVPWRGLGVLGPMEKLCWEAWLLWEPQSLCSQGRWAGYCWSRGPIPSVLARCLPAPTTALQSCLPCNELSYFLLLTCLGDFTHSASRLINLLRKGRKGKGEGGVQPRVRYSGGVGASGQGSPRLPRPIAEHGGGGQVPHPHQGHRVGVLGPLWVS